MIGTFGWMRRDAAVLVRERDRLLRSRQGRSPPLRQHLVECAFEVYLELPYRR